jgi:hypothetical protein
LGSVLPERSAAESRAPRLRASRPNARGDRNPKFRSNVRTSSGALCRESGQAAVEYSLFTFFILIGAVLGLGGFLPASLAAYEAYIDGFWMVLGLPIP